VAADFHNRETSQLVTGADMMDLAMLALSVGFFAVAVGYVVLCDHL
jgi:hypothetical protein